MISSFSRSLLTLIHIVSFTHLWQQNTHVNIWSRVQDYYVIERLRFTTISQLCWHGIRLKRNEINMVQAWILDPLQMKWNEAEMVALVGRRPADWEGRLTYRCSDYVWLCLYRVIMCWCLIMFILLGMGWRTICTQNPGIAKIGLTPQPPNPGTLANLANKSM